MEWYYWVLVIMGGLTIVDYFFVKAGQFLHGCDEDVKRMKQ